MFARARWIGSIKHIRVEKESVLCGPGAWNRESHFI
jgi:hypothetical protein